MYQPEGSNLVPATDGVFFLQRTSKTQYLARFSFKTENIQHFKEHEFNASEGVHTSGLNLSAITLQNMQVRTGGKIPEVPALAEISNDDFGEQTQFPLSGYPEMVLGG